MKQQIYKSWQGNFNQWLFIEQMNEEKDFNACWYNAIVKTMRFIARNIYYSNGDFKQELKNDLKQVREYFLSNKL
jgi:hypothetical protein